MRKKSFEAPKSFIPGGAKIDASDPRKATRRNVQVDVPKVAQRGPSRSYKAIDLIDRRKSADVIKTEIDDIQLKQSRYRPAYVQPISADSEKDRLSQVFTFKGGKALPDELTNPVGVAPFEIAAKKKEQERLQSIRLKRGGSLRRGPRTAPVLSVEEQLAEQIRSEIDERTQHLHEMRALGVKDKETALKAEIARKVAELKSLKLD